MTVYELCERDVVNVTTGQNLGKVDDISFEPETARITGVILYGRLKLFGLLGREEDTAIPWGDIEKIGTDVLLVRTAVSCLLYTSPSPRDRSVSRMPSSA